MEKWKNGWKKEWQVLIIIALAVVVWIFRSASWEMIQIVWRDEIYIEHDGTDEEQDADGETKEVEERITIVIDPGHGSDDPGKVGVSGTLEKDLNLSIGWKVNALLEAQGYTVIMTREDDNGLLEDVEYSAQGDLTARVELINATNPDMVVSIHQNSYTSESVSGPQVFYYTQSSAGEVLAQAIQTELWELDLDSHREIKANDTYYLLAHCEPPTVIVECGFLSNASDEAKLITDSYQEELAESIVAGIETYLYETR